MCVVSVPGRNTPRKKTKPVIFLLPELPNITYDIENISKKIKSILEELKIHFKVLNKRGNNLSLDIWTTEDTWSNQRRKRRLMKRLQDGNVKKPKLKGMDTVDCNVSDTCKPGEKSDNEEKITSKDLATQKMVNNSSTSGKSLVYNNISCEKCRKEDINENKTIPQATLNSANSGTSNSKGAEIVVHAFLKLYMKDSDILLEMEFLDGTAGKEGLHQIVQYIKNNWK